MKCFYHNDIDGRCAGSVVAQNTNNYDPENFFEVDYANDLPIDVIAPGEEVYFVDYSFKESTLPILQEIMAKTDKLVWIDHHTSSLELIRKYPELSTIPGLRANGISGAALTYMYFNDISVLEDCPMYIQLVSDYDCWLFTLGEDTMYFKYGIDSVPNDALDPIWDGLYSQSEGVNDIEVLEETIDIGRAVDSYVKSTNAYYRSHFAYESEISGYPCMVVNRKSNSAIFGELYKEYPIVMTWVFDGTKYTYSIFSSNADVDCSKIAERFGGGGHKGAAGFTSNELLFKKVEVHEQFIFTDIDKERKTHGEKYWR